MGRWREAPEGLADMAPPDLWGGGAKRRRGWQIWLLPIYGEVARSAGGAGRYGSSPFMGRWREAPEGLADMAPPHLWGGGGEAAGGADPTSIPPTQPIHNSLTTPGKD